MAWAVALVAVALAVLAVALVAVHKLCLYLPVAVQVVGLRL